MGARPAALTLIVTLTALAAACGGYSSPAPTPSTGGSGTSASCRTFATNATAVSTVVSGIRLTGAFNSSTRQFTSTVIYPSGSVCTTAVFSYLSIADFVDEVKVVPGLVLATSSTTTIGPACGSTGTSTINYSFDSQRRLTQSVQSGSTITYSAWDSAGRPTAGSAPFGSISNVYDDAARTQTQTQGGTVTTLTYDANGILLQQVDKTGANTGTTTWTISSTDKVCK